MIYNNEGLPFCKFDLKNEFEFLRNTTAPKLHAYSVTGIFDKKTSKLYDVNVFTLLHLGAERFNLHKDDGILKQD